MRLQPTRAASTGIVSVLALAALVAARHSLVLESLFLFVFVVAQGRSRLPWIDWLPAAPLVRRSARVAFYFVPIIILGLPPLRLTLSDAGIAVLVPLPALAAEWRNIRLGLSRRFRALLEPLPAMERARDLIGFGLAGLAQEYLYRYLVIAALAPVIGWPAILVATILFVGEHLTHPRHLHRWDRMDLAVQAYLGLSLGIVTYITGSWLTAAIAHTLYNFPNVIQTILRPGHSASPVHDPRPITSASASE